MGYEIISTTNDINTSNLPYGISTNFTDQGIFTLNYIEKSQVFDNLKNLLLTKPYERFYTLSYGCNLINFVFDPNTDELKENISNSIQSSINKWLPYINIKLIEVHTTEDDPYLTDSVKITLLTEYNGINLDSVTINIDSDGILTLK